MKIAILINEDLNEMVLGINTTLSYILAAVDLRSDVYVCQIAKNGEISKQIVAIFLNKNNAQNLVDAYRHQNQEIVRSLAGGALPAKKLVKDLGFVFENKEISFDEIDFVIQRLEPMKPPFPPFGEVDIDNFLRDFSSRIFTKNKNYNLPIDCFGDKELPLMLENQEIATPSEISFLGDEKMLEKIRKFGKKVILKPDNSAQAFGVFCLEFDENGLNLAEIEQNLAKNLINREIFKIKNCDDGELAKIIEILLFLQDFKAKKLDFDQKIADFSKNDIKNGAKALYGNKILIQPFIEGVKMGDIRVILAKFGQKFVEIGKVFRKSIIKNQEKFATGIMSQGSIPVVVEDVLTSQELQDLNQKTNYVLQQLNTKFSQKYQNCYEIGLDFLPFGDKKRVFLGEANHYCQGLIPLLEAVARNSKIEYGGGLNIAKYIISNQILLT